MNLAPFDVVGDQRLDVAEAGEGGWVTGRGGIWNAKQKTVESVLKTMERRRYFMGRDSFATGR